MARGGRESIQFTLNGQLHELSRQLVERRVVDVAPDAIRKHAVRINGTWFPVLQAFEIATGIPRSAFITNTARRHLAALGYEVIGDVEPRTDPPGVRRQSRTPAVSGAAPALAEEKLAKQAGEWHTEANVQAALVTALVGDHWRITSVANTATKEHGIDVIASREAQTIGVEVKGFPSKDYADPARAGEVKRTSPSTQAGHWYAQAVLAAMRLRGKEPGWRSVIALPDFPRYRDLYTETSRSIAAAKIEVWWIKQDGTLHSLEFCFRR